MPTPKNTGDAAGVIVESVFKGVKILAVLAVIFFLTSIGLFGALLYIILTRI